MILTKPSSQTALTTDRQHWSRAELDQQVNHRIDLLKALGIQRLGIYLDNGIQWIAFDLAAQRAGITCIPLPKFFSQEQLLHSVERVGMDGIVTDETPLIKKILPLFSLSPTDLEGAQLLLNKKIFHDQPLLATSSDGKQNDIISKVTFTSGTTGQPKGVMLTRTAIDHVTNSLASLLQHVGIEKHLCLIPLPILLENIAGVYLPLLLGATVMAPTTAQLGVLGSSGLDLEKFAKAIQHYEPSSLILLPQLLLALTLLAEQKKIPTDSFRFLAVGGGAVSPRLIERARQAGLPVYEGYGLSECSSVVALNTPLHDRIGSVGRILPHQSVRVEDKEIVVEGSGFSGYLGDTNPRFNNGIVRTGDEGFIDDDGFLFINGRKKNIIVTAFGRNINPEWPESLLLASEYIQQAIVVGDARPFLSAIIVARAEHLDQVQKHIDGLNKNLPDYAQISQWVWSAPLVFNKKNLLTSNGRIKRSDAEKCFHAELEQLYLTAAANASILHNMPASAGSNTR